MTLSFLKNNWTYLLGGVYAALLAVFIANEAFWFLLLPLFATVAVLAIFKLDALLLTLSFLTPLSINLEEFGSFPVAMFLPTEPIIFGILLLFIIRLFFKGGLSREMVLHPISLIIIWQLAWMVITATASSMPMVSFKYVLARSWFVASFYFLGIALFKDAKKFRQFIWLYILGMCCVAVYTVSMHANTGFDYVAAHWVMSPFFKDHTSYGAMLAFVFPFIIGFFFRKKLSVQNKWILAIILIILTVAIVLSYTRAAWLSLIVALGVLGMVLFRIKFKTLLLVVGFAGLMIFAASEQIMQTLERNDQDAKGGLSEHVMSMANITTDASNLERLNRWGAAFRMFKDRPVFGWGPGTYQFKYAPYQLPSEKTIISTNAGDVGNAHSEYIGPLAEQGLIGMLNMLLLVGFSIYLGIRLFSLLEDRELALLALCATLALITYFTHGFLNNFLDTDKASVPVWSCIALLVSLDIYHRQKQLNQAEE